MNNETSASEVTEPAEKPSLRIAFDGKRATKNLTGLGNYSRWLISRLAEFYPGNSYLVYTPDVKKSPRIQQFLAQAGILLRKPANTFLWRTWGIIKDLAKDNVTLYHGLSHEIPFSLKYARIKSVVTIHDLIFLKFPQHYKKLDRLIYRFKSSYACRSADKIIAISERTKADVMHFYGTPEEKIEVIYQSCDDSFKIAAPEEQKELVRKKYKLPEKYILYVGTIESRKNLVVLVNAIAKVNESFHLVVVGRKTSYYSKVEAAIKANGLEKRVRFFENMDFADLPAIYQHAEVFVLPSYYEGFGIPVIEALYSGIPVIAASGSCLEEAGGPSSLYVDPDDVSGFSNAINRVVGDNDLRDKMISDGHAYVQRFDNKVLTDQLMACYLKILQP